MRDFLADARTGSLVLIASPTGEARRRWVTGLLGAFVTRELADWAALRMSLSSLKPSVLLLDLALPALGGTSGVPRLKQLSGLTRIVLLASSPDEREAATALRAGAWGYCGRDLDDSLMRKVVETVLKGELWVSRRAIPYLLDRHSAGEAAKPDARAGSNPSLARLTSRQTEIAWLIAAGASNKEIGIRLHVTEKTVKAHLSAIFRKLGVASRLHPALLVAANARRQGSLNHRTKVQ